MDRDTAITLSVGVLAIVALGAAAATLETAVTLGGGDGGTGFGSGTADDGSTTGAGSGPLIPGSFSGEIGPICYPVLREPLVMGAIALAFVGLFAFIYRDSGDQFSALVVCGVAAVPVGIVWTLLAFCGDPLSSDSSDEDVETGLPIEPGSTNESRFPLLGGGGSGEASGTAISSPTVIVFLLIGIALLGAVAVVLASRGDDDSGIDRPEASSTAAPDVAAVARAAGEAADRIAADVAVDNEVFRAWATMTDALDLESPDTTTPAAFERAAIDAGMDPDDVAELRELFEEVRYGGQTATEDREQRAISALRRVESAYGDLGSDGEDR